MPSLFRFLMVVATLSAVTAGGLYVLFGVALLLAPVFGALLMVTLSGVLAILFSVGLFAIAWRLYQSSKGAAA